jgi:hypothetical protein
VVGELPDRGSVANPSQYTCVFGFSQYVIPNLHPVTEATDLFVDGEPGVEMSGGGFLYGYITEGTNDAQKGMIYIEDNPIRPADQTPVDQDM